MLSNEVAGSFLCGLEEFLGLILWAISSLQVLAGDGTVFVDVIDESSYFW